jgi:hypothetical protein
LDDFTLVVISSRRTIERLDRRIRATPGCDPSADSSPEWMAAFAPASWSARSTI